MPGRQDVSLSLGFPEADPEIKIQVQIVYLRGDPRKHQWGVRWGETANKENMSQPLPLRVKGALFHWGTLEWYRTTEKRPEVALHVQSQGMGRSHGCVPGRLWQPRKGTRVAGSGAGHHHRKACYLLLNIHSFRQWTDSYLVSTWGRILCWVLGKWFSSRQIHTHSHRGMKTRGATNKQTNTQKEDRYPRISNSGGITSTFKLSLNSGFYEIPTMCWPSF